MRRLASALTIVIAGTLGIAAQPAAATSSIDWNDRSTVDVTLPSGWHLEACEGDAPYLCATDPQNRPDGSILMMTTDIPFGADTSAAAIEARATELVRDVEADRKMVCGDDHAAERHPVTATPVAGLPGYRYGFTLRDGDGAVTEHIVLHLTFANGQEFLTSTAFSDPEACPGEDPERDEFHVSARSAIEPYLDDLMAEANLPTDLDAGPLCLARTVPQLTFEDVPADNAHRRGIACTSWIGLFNGRTTQIFDPAASVTRAEVAAVAARLVRATGTPLLDTDAEPFDDTDRSPHRADIDALAEAGVIHGTGPRRFEPERPVTRSQATAVLVGAYEYALNQRLFDAGVTFSDVRGTHADAISRAATAGMVRGTSEGHFGSLHQMRRDQLATVVARAANRLGGTAHLMSPPAG